MRKIIQLFIFLVIWIGFPAYMAEKYDSVLFFLLMLVTWFPALAITLFISDDEKFPD